MSKKPLVISMKDMESICNLIRSGNYVKTSVLASGVNYNTYLDYMKKGKKGKEPYVKYYEMQEQAKAEYESEAVSAINKSGAEGNIGAYMWALPRMFPQRWGSVKRVEAKVDNSQTIHLVKHSDLNKDEDSE